MNRSACPWSRGYICQSWTAVLVVSFCSLCAPGIFAQPSSNPQASEADAKFSEGLQKMRSGKFAEACPELLESYRLDPALGAMFTVAECEASWGKPATAVEHYEIFINGLASLEPAKRDKYDERRRIALEKIAALTSAAPELEIDVAAGAPAELIVKCNDGPMDSSSYGIARRVDPGKYVISAELNGKVVWQRQIALNERDKARVEIPWSQGASPESIAPATRPSSPTSNGDSTSRSNSGSRTWVYVTGGVGAVGFTTGIVAGVLALGKKSTINDNCPNQICNPQGRSALDTAKHEALISTIGFSVGLAGAAAATVLLLTSSSMSAESQSPARLQLRPIAAVSNHGGGFGLQGEFQ